MTVTTFYPTKILYRLHLNSFFLKNSSVLAHCDCQEPPRVKSMIRSRSESPILSILFHSKLPHSCCMLCMAFAGALTPGSVGTAGAVVRLWELSSCLLPLEGAIFLC